MAGIGGTGLFRPFLEVHGVSGKDSAAVEMTESRVEDEAAVKMRRMDLNYMHRPPRIVPNYGKKSLSVLPKSSVSRVLLYDNVTQQQMLDVKLSHIKTEQQKTTRLLDLHRKSFLIRRLMKQQHAQDHKTTTPGVLDYLLPILLAGEDNPGRDSSSPRHPKFVHSSAGEYTYRDEDLKLPDIAVRRSGRVTFKGSNGGVTRIMHTMNTGGEQSNSGQMWAKRRTVLDKRFQGLESLLVRLDDPGNGYIELSPSYHRETSQAPPSLSALRTTVQTGSAHTAEG
ncbi:uncharacterized protein LOC124142944 isoform X1 [Haliotis rufescens]|uniref:uncharacterized protein LOC124142944 isoform X1 n=2 Tax=Haliotis rufescens TaxID=6454 RepID=UPI001EB07B47|nr:uncharacterized protein LOC124142944 isoform X1 [Haliotis rufescens]